MAIFYLNDPTSSEELEALFQRENEAREQADSRVSQEQLLQPGDFCVSNHGDIRVYSEVLDAAKHLLGNRLLADLDEDELAEYQATLDSYKDPHMRYFRFSRGFSWMCPQGELGDFHLSVVTRKLTQSEFEAARKAGWP